MKLLTTNSAISSWYECGELLHLTCYGIQPTILFACNLAASDEVVEVVLQVKLPVNLSGTLPAKHIRQIP